MNKQKQSEFFTQVVFLFCDWLILQQALKFGTNGAYSDRKLRVSRPRKAIQQGTVFCFSAQLRGLKIRTIRLLCTNRRLAFCTTTV